MAESDSAPEDVVVVTIRSQRDERGSMLTVEGEVDVVSANQFRAALNEALLEPPGVLVVDLTGVTFLGSMGLSLLLEAQTSAGPGVLRVVAIDGPRRTFGLTGLDQVLTVIDTVDDAFSVGRSLA